MAQSLIVLYILRVTGRNDSLRYASCRKLPYSYADKIRSRHYRWKLRDLIVFANAGRSHCNLPLLLIDLSVGVGGEFPWYLDYW